MHLDNGTLLTIAFVVASSVFMLGALLHNAPSQASRGNPYSVNATMLSAQQCNGYCWAGYSIGSIYIRAVNAQNVTGTIMYNSIGVELGMPITIMPGTYVSDCQGHTISISYMGSGRVLFSIERAAGTVPACPV